MPGDPEAWEVQVRGLPSYRGGLSWLGGLQRGPTECELLGPTSGLEVTGDVTTSLLSQLSVEFLGPQSGVDLT